MYKYRVTKYSLHLIRSATSSKCKKSRLNIGKGSIKGGNSYVQIGSAVSVNLVKITLTP